MTRDARVIYTAEDRTAAATSSVKRGMQSVSEVAAMAGVSLASLGSAATLAGLAMMIKRINDNVDALNDLKDATGASIENISALEDVAKRNGHSFDTVGQSLVKFNQALGRTLKPGSDAEKVLKAIGLNAQQLRAMDPAEALRQTAVALSQFADDGNKARATQELFGKSLREVAPFLKDLSEQGKLNAKVTTEQAEAAEKFNKELFKLNATMGDVGRSIANPLVTGMNALIQRFKDGKTEGESLIVTLLKLSDPKLWIAQKLGFNVMGPGNGYTRAREGISTIERALADPTLSASERAAMVGRQTSYRQQLEGYLNSTAGAGRGMGGYENVPKTTLELPPDPDKGAAARAKTSADAQIREAMRVAQERQKLRNQEYTEIDKWFKDQAELEKKALDESRRRYQEFLTAHDDAARAGVMSVESRVAALNKEISGWGRLQSEIEATKLVRMEDWAAAAAAGGESVDVINQQIDAQRRLVDALKSRETLDAVKVTTDAAKREWDQVADSMVDALMQGGKSVAQYLKSLFRTLVLRPILAPIGQAMSGFFGGGGTAPAAAGVTSGGGGLGSLFSGGGLNNMGLVGAGIQAFTGASVGASAASLGAANLVGAVGGDALGALIAGNGAWAGVSAGAAGAGGAAAGGLAAGAAAAIPVIGWAVAIGSLLYSMFGKKGGGPKAEGYFNPYNSDAYFSSRDSNVDSSAASAAKALQGQYDAITKAYGGGGGLQFGLGFSMDPKGKAPTALHIGAGRGGQSAFDLTRGDIGRDEKDLQAAIAEMGSRAMLKGLQQSNLSGILGKYLNDLGDVATLAADKVTEAITRMQKASAEKIALEDRWFQLTHTETEILARNRQREIEALDESNRALAKQIHLREDELTLLQQARSAIEAARGSSQQAMQFIAGVRLNMQGYIDNLNATPAGLLSPESQLANARSQFDRELGLAKGGNRASLEGITGYADRLIQAQTAWSASGGATQDTISMVKSALSDLPGLVSGEQLIVDAIRESGAQVVLTLEHLKASISNDFEQFDLDASGALDLTELKSYFGPLASDAMLAQVVSKLDANGNGQISKLEALGASVRAASVAEVAAISATVGAASPGAVTDAAAAAAARTINASLPWGQQPIEVATAAASGGPFWRNPYTGMTETNPFYTPESSFAVGTPYVPRDMTARIHKGEAIMPAATAQRWRDDNGAEMKGLREDVRRLTVVVASYAQRDLESGGRIERNTAASARAAALKETAAAV